MRFGHSRHGAIFPLLHSAAHSAAFMQFTVTLANPIGSVNTSWGGFTVAALRWYLIKALITRRKCYTTIDIWLLASENLEEEEASGLPWGQASAETATTLPLCLSGIQQTDTSGFLWHTFKIITDITVINSCSSITLSVTSNTNFTCSGSLDGNLSS